MKRIILIGFFLVLLFSEAGFAQWKKLNTFGDGLTGIGCIYFIDSSFSNGVGFVGLKTNENKGEEVWRTSDGGYTWKKVFNASSRVDGNWVSGFSFKDSMVGWFSLHNFGGVYKTVDGGNSWFLLPGTTGDVSAVFYNSRTKKLFASFWSGKGIVSDDEGQNWSPMPIGGILNSYVTQDNLSIIVSTAKGGFPSPNPYILSQDGGVTWNFLSFGEESYHPVIKDGVIYALSEDGGKLYLSFDFGQNWYLSYQFPFMVTGTMGYNQYGIFCQSYRDIGGVYKSVDSGKNWISICGPSNYYDTRFFCANDRLYAGDDYGNLYLNRSGKGNGVRLKIDGRNQQTVYFDKLFPINIFYPNESNYEAVDSVCFTLNLKGEMMGYELDSVADGWKIKWRSITDSTMKYCLQRTTTDTVAFNSLMLRLYFKAYLTRDTTAQLTLDEVNFNQDVTFRDCMIPTLSATDTVNFVIQNECGDSTLRAFLNSKPVLEILSIFPNPTSGDVAVSYSSLLEQNINLQVSDFIGKVKIEETLSPRIGINNYTIPIQKHWSGTFFLRLQMGKDVVTGKFVKQ